MTERTIRTLAEELAGQFYDQKRSNRFRSKDSLTRVKTVMRDPDTGVRKEVTKTMPFFTAYPTSKLFAKAHWPLFVDAARKCMTTMLALSDSRISPHLKEGIYAALTEDREQQVRTGGKRLLQRHVGDHAI